MGSLEAPPEFLPLDSQHQGLPPTVSAYNLCFQFAFSSFQIALSVSPLGQVFPQSTSLSCVCPQLCLTAWTSPQGSLRQQRTHSKWPIGPNSAPGNIFIFVKSTLLWAMRAPSLFKLVLLRVWSVSQLSCYFTRRTARPDQPF